MKVPPILPTTQLFLSSGADHDATGIIIIPLYVAPRFHRLQSALTYTMSGNIVSWKGRRLGCYWTSAKMLKFTTDYLDNSGKTADSLWTSVAKPIK